MTWYMLQEKKGVIYAGEDDLDSMILHLVASLKTI